MSKNVFRNVVLYLIWLNPRRPLHRSLWHIHLFRFVRSYPTKQIDLVVRLAFNDTFENFRIVLANLQASSGLVEYLLQIFDSSSASFRQDKLAPSWVIIRNLCIIFGNLRTSLYMARSSSKIFVDPSFPCRDKNSRICLATIWQLNITKRPNLS